MGYSLELGSTVSLFDPSDVERALSKTTSKDQEHVRMAYREMLDRGPSRFVTQPGSSEVLCSVNALCPNFSGVIQDISNYIELALVGKGGLKLLPILLAGDPGVGKTHFSKCLAKALGMPFQFINMATLTASWILSGSAPSWHGAKKGSIAESLLDSDFASHVYLVDELDKTGGDNRFDPYGALLQLLERETAQHFKDEFLNVPLDASSLVWIATANDTSRIPSYILSRMAVYEVPRPTTEQSQVIATNIYSGLISEYRWEYETTLKPDTLDTLCTVPPRELRKKLMDGLACALSDKRTWLEPRDIRSSHVKAPRSIGFHTAS